MSSTKNWDAIARQAEEEERREKVPGDQGLLKLLKQVFENSTEEQRRAIEKSFVESNGTVINCNWQEVGPKFVTPKPLDPPKPPPIPSFLRAKMGLPPIKN